MSHDLGNSMMGGPQLCLRARSLPPRPPRMALAPAPAMVTLLVAVFRLGPLRFFVLEHMPWAIGDEYLPVRTKIPHQLHLQTVLPQWYVNIKGELGMWALAEAGSRSRPCLSSPHSKSPAHPLVVWRHAPPPPACS